MKPYIIHLVASGVFSFLIMMIPPILDSPDELAVLLVIGPFFYIPFLKYPAIILTLAIVLFLKMKIKFSPSFISSSIITFTILLTLLGPILKLNFMRGIKHETTWQLWLISIISCTISILFVYRIKNK